MKRPILILVPVLLLLALALFYFGNQVPKTAESAKQGPVRGQNPVRRALIGAKEQLNREPEIQHFSWREVESDDYRQYVANLRRINVPELTVVDIIVADVNRLFSERATKLKADNKQLLEYNYWQVNSAGSTNRAATMRFGAEMQSLNRERLRLINDLLGKEITDPLVLQKPDAFKYVPPASVYSLDFLPEAKRLVYNALKEAAMSELRSAVPEGVTDDRSMQLRKALSEKYEAEWAKILSPAEKLEYDARFSTIAQRLRDTLAGMQPTQEEFLQIVSLGRRFYDEYEGIYSKYEREDPMKIPDKLKAKREMDAQLEQALGAERFQQLQRGLDIGYGSDTRFVTELGLNQDTANELYRLREDLRKGAVLNQLSLLSGQNLEAAKLEAIKLLGEEAFQNYTNRVAGRWLTGRPNSLAPIISIKTRPLIQESR